MGIGDTLSKEITAWGTVAIVIVVISIVLLKFKTTNPGNMTCPGADNATHVFFNESSNLCCAGTSFSVGGTCAGTGNSSAIGSVASSLDTFVVALSEPKNWVAIVIIGIIGFALLKLFKSKKGD